MCCEAVLAEALSDALQGKEEDGVGIHNPQWSEALGPEGPAQVMYKFRELLGALLVSPNTHVTMDIGLGSPRCLESQAPKPTVTASKWAQGSISTRVFDIPGLGYP